MLLPIEGTQRSDRHSSPRLLSMAICAWKKKTAISFSATRVGKHDCCWLRVETPSGLVSRYRGWRNMAIALIDRASPVSILDLAERSIHWKKWRRIGPYDVKAFHPPLRRHPLYPPRICRSRRTRDFDFPILQESAPALTRCDPLSLGIASTLGYLG